MVFLKQSHVVNLIEVADSNFYKALTVMFEISAVSYQITNKHT